MIITIKGQTTVQVGELSATIPEDEWIHCLMYAIRHNMNPKTLVIERMRGSLANSNED